MNHATTILTCSGRKAFNAYLGSDKSTWLRYDATALMQEQDMPPYPGGILIDQGLDDKFLIEQLHPHLFEEACRRIGQPLTLRRHARYDHGYYFISSFIEDHLVHHKTQLRLS
jgi:S-formylglutathione hydrolase